MTGPVLDRTGRVVGVAGPHARRAGHVHRAAGAGRRRGVRPARALAGHRQAGRPADGRRGPALLHQPAHRRRPPRVAGWSSGTPSRTARRILMPGYGWIFGVGDGTSNVGLGILNSSAAYGSTDYRGLLASWLGGTARGVGLRRENATGPVRGGGLPMGFNRTPHYSRGLLLAGDSGRRGEPVQRRGHRVRDGDRQAGGRARRAGAGPAGRTAAGSGRWRRTRRR